MSQEEVLEWFEEAIKEKLMSGKDYAKYLDLPEKLTVYRGVGEKSREDGISWTIDKDTAIWFANRFSEGYVLQGVVDKKDVLVFFNGRNESEIVVAPENVQEKIKLP